MKTPPAVIALWGMNLAIFLGGAAAVGAVYMGFDDTRGTIRDDLAKYQPKAPEKWDELVTRSADHMMFEKVRLVPGEPEVIPPEPIKNGPTEPVKQPPVDLVAPIKAMEDGAKKVFTDQHPIEIGSMLYLTMTLKIEDWSNTQTLTNGADIVKILKDSKKDALAAKLPFDRCILASSEVGKIIYYVSTKALQDKVAQARREQETRKDAVSVIDKAIKDGILTGDALYGIIKVAYENVGPVTPSEEALRGELEGRKPLAPPAAGTATPGTGSGPVVTTDGKDGDLPKPTEIKPGAVEVVAVAPTPSKFDEATNTWFVGTADMTEEIANDLGNYVETATDAKGNQIGIRVRDNLPANESNVAYKMGAKAGDIVISINGTAVKSMQDIRSVVGTQRNAGVEKFDVVYERDGLRQTKSFNAPKKTK